MDQADQQRVDGPRGDVFSGKPDTIVRTVTIRHIRMQLVRPYHLSYRTFNEFEPYVIELEGEDGSTAWGDGHISPGSSAETRESGWDFCNEISTRLVGLRVGEALALVKRNMHYSKVAASAMAVGLEMLQHSPLFESPERIEFPLVTPINSTEPDAIREEVESHVNNGFRTFKIKVGKDVQADLRRVATIQKAAPAGVMLRIDANRGYSVEEGVTFASSLNPDSIALFEQPCPAENWDANAAVARASVVPLMLDEAICSLADIERASNIPGVGFCKLKLKRFGSLAGLVEGLERVRELGMEPVLGDGLGSEITSWFEACAARGRLRNAGEFNGFLKPRERLFTNPLEYEKGKLIVRKGYKPIIDKQRLDKFTEKIATFVI